MAMLLCCLLCFVIASLQFLLLSEEDSSPIKAIDFGLAIFFDPQNLPVAGLNPEGTPWWVAHGLLEWRCCCLHGAGADDAIGVDLWCPLMPKLCRGGGAGAMGRCGDVGPPQVVTCSACLLCLL